MCFLFFVLCICCVGIIVIAPVSLLAIQWTGGAGLSVFALLYLLAVFIAAPYLIGYAFQAITGKFQGNVWGIQIRAPKKVKIFRVIGILIGIFCVFVVFTNLHLVILVFGGVIGSGLSGLFTGDFKPFVFTFLGVLVIIVIVLFSFKTGFSLAIKVGLRLYSFTPDLMKLGQLPIFKNIDLYIDQADWIKVTGKEIRLQNYKGQIMCFVFADYNLPDLTRMVRATEEKEVADLQLGFLGLYITQKYKNKFVFSVKTTRVKGSPGSPGVSVFIVTPSGVVQGRVGGTSRTPDKYAFDGYTFVRKRRLHSRK